MGQGPLQLQILPPVNTDKSQVVTHRMTSQLKWPVPLVLGDSSFLALTLAWSYSGCCGEMNGRVKTVRLETQRKGNKEGL